MPLKSTVAAERRMDLASLFCMIGRHGPAVALAVIAMVSVLAGFIIYRTVRGKRRKAAAAEGDGKSSDTERDASVIHPRPEESHSSVESTDVSDEGSSSDVKEDVDEIRSDLKIRHRPAAASAAEKKPPTYSPLNSDVQAPENKYPTSDDTEEMAAVWDSYKVAETYAEEANQGLPSDTYTVAEMVMERVVDCQQGATDNIVKDVIEEVHDNDSFLKQPESINDQSHSQITNDGKRAEEECVDFQVTPQRAEIWSSAFEQETNLPSAQQDGCDRATDKVMPPIRDSDWDEDGGLAGEVTEEVVDVIEEVHDNDSCLKEPEPIDDENHEEEEEMVLKAECQEDEDVTTDKETRHGEENFQCSLNNQVFFEQTSYMGEEVDNEGLQDNKTTLETNRDSNTQEPVILIEDVPAPSICYSRDEEFEEENPDSIDCSSYSSNNRLSPDGEKKNDGERVEEECVNQVTAQQAEIGSTTFEQETNLPSAQQDQRDHVTDTVMPPIRDSDWDEDDGLAGEVNEVVDDDHLNKLTAVTLDTHLPQFDEQEVKIEQKEENVLDGADQVNEKLLTSDNILASSEESNSSSVALPCLNVPIKVDNHDDGLSGITPDAKAQISAIADFSDLSSGCQSQNEDKIAPSLDEDTDSTFLGPKIPSHETENLPENNRNETTVMLAEECNDQVYDPQVQSCQQQDQQSVQMLNNEVFDKSVAADPDTVENVTASVIAEEISCPHPPSICKDQQSGHMENDETRVTDLLSEEISHPDMLSSSKDQQSDHMEIDQDFSEAAAGAAPVMTKDISPTMCQIGLPSFEQSQQKDNDILSPGVSEESGISSLAVSPDLQDAGNEFDMTVGIMLPPVMDSNLQCEGKTEAQNSLFADDVAISVINEATAGMVFGPYPSHPSQAAGSEHTDWIRYESFAANEDMFGHEIEDGYHRAMDQFAAHVAASVTSYSDDLKMKTDMKAFIEVEEIKEQKAGESVEKKEDTKSEKEKEEDCEKSEISIMEATMDNNEWITESNYQVLPWMNLSAPSFAQDHTKTNQLPTEECQYSSAVTDTTCTDTTDIPTSAEQTGTLSLVDENTENNKKVVAVQPMPQNVNVTFRVHYFTQSPFQTVAVTGNQQELGNWKGFIPLERAKDGHWATVVSLPAESHVEWKFVVLDKGEVCRWEECGNRLLDTGYGDDLLVHQWWGLL